MAGCNHLRPIEGTETHSGRRQCLVACGCNHLRPIEGTETTCGRARLRASFVATTYDPLRVLKPSLPRGMRAAAVATTYDPLRVLKRSDQLVEVPSIAGCNHLRPIEGTETRGNRPLRGAFCGCNHLRPIEGTETNPCRSYAERHGVATTYDPLRVLKRLYCLSLLSSEWQLRLPATRAG